MALTFATAKTELLARGFDDLDTTRQSYFINRGYQMVCNKYPWPFLEATTTGTSPLTISDLRQILYVIDTTNDQELIGIDQREIRGVDPDITSTGTPTHYYLTGTTTLTVWPPNTSVSLSVRYYKVPAALTGTDALLVPERYEYLVIDAAVILAYRDSDNFDAAGALKAEWEYEVGEMAKDLLSRNFGNADLVEITGLAGEWGA
jgi:hypothetical protein